MFYWLPISVISLHKWRKIKTQNKGLASHHRAPRHLKTLYVFLQFLSWKLSCLIFIKQRGGEGNDRGWDGWMESRIPWIWVWANSRRWWRTGKPGVLYVVHGVAKSQTWLSDWSTTTANVIFAFWFVSYKPLKEKAFQDQHKKGRWWLISMWKGAQPQ